MFKILFGTYESLALAIDPDSLEPLNSDLVADAIFDKAAGRDFYGHLLRTLEEAGGFQ